MTQLTVQHDDGKVVVHFDGMPQKVHDALVAKVTALRLQGEGTAKAKVSGDVLNVQSGALRRSIFSTTEDRGDKGVYGHIASSGDVKYAMIHEFGYNGTEHVREHLRTITQVFGNPFAGPLTVSVKAFDRAMNMPERSFLRSTLNEMAPYIESELKKAVQEAVAE